MNLYDAICRSDLLGLRILLFFNNWITGPENLKKLWHFLNKVIFHYKKDSSPQRDKPLIFIIFLSQTIFMKTNKFDSKFFKP